MPEFGTVVKFDDERGFGFIRRDGAGGDIFVHRHALERCGIDYVAIGDRLQFEIEQGRRDGRPEAQKLARA